MRFGGAGQRRIGAAAALVAMVGLVTVVVLTTGSPASSGGGRDGATTSGSVRVQRRDLVKTDTEAGTLSHPGGRTVYNRLGGTITWLPRVGEVIRPGHALFDVDGRPVILMQGSTPAYRTLSAADGAGADIEQLNRDLVALGYNDGALVVDDEWQDATTDGVQLLQRSLGERETGRLALGEVVFLPGPRLVSSVDASVGSAGGATAARVGPPPPRFVSLHSTSTTTSTPATRGTTPTTSTTPTTVTQTTLAQPPSTGSQTTAAQPSSTGSGANALSALTARLKAQGAQLRAQAARLRALAAQVRGDRNRPSSGGSGNGGAPGAGNGGRSPSTGSSATPILQTTSPQLLVTVDLSPSSQSEAIVGEHVTVQMPAGNTVRGRIRTVSPVAKGPRNGNGGGGGQDAGSGGSSQTVPVTITLPGRPRGGGLDQASVSVTFAQSVARHVLSVPVTALLATSGAHYAVQGASASRPLIPVRTGLFAAGYVQISGRGIHPGLRVTDSQG